MGERGGSGRRHVVRAVAGVLALAVQTGCAGGPPSGPDGGPAGDGYYGTVVDNPPVSLPSATLVDTDGDTVDLQAVSAAPVTLTVFAYTTCPDECPLTVSSVAAALRGLPEEQRAAVQVVVLSADPARDTPSRLRRWLDRFDRSFVGLTGDATTLQRVAGELYVPLEVPSPEPSPTGDEDVAHGVQIWSFDADDESLLLWSGTPTPTQLRSDLSRLLRDQQSGG